MEEVRRGADLAAAVAERTLLLLKFLRCMDDEALQGPSMLEDRSRPL